MRHWPPPANCSCQGSTLKFFKGHTFWRGAPGLCDQEADEKPLSRKSKQQHPDVDPFRGWWSSRNGICLSSWNISAAHSREWELCSTENGSIQEGKNGWLTQLAASWKLKKRLCQWRFVLSCCILILILMLLLFLIWNFCWTPKLKKLLYNV